MSTLRQRAVLRALAAAAVLSGVAAAVVLPVTGAAASVAPAPPHTVVSVRIAGEARVGAVLNATLEDASASENAPLEGEALLLPEGATVLFEWLSGGTETVQQSPPVVARQISCEKPVGVANAAPATATPPPVAPGTEPTAGPASNEYTVQPADLGQSIRARATISIDGQVAARCESAATLAVVAKDTVRPGGETPGEFVPPTAETPPLAEAPPPVELVPSQWRPSYSSQQGTSPAAPNEQLPQAEPAAAGPVVAISLSSEVMLIGGAAVLVVLGGLAIFGRAES